MSHEPAEIKAHIKAQGESLRENIEEIETRVKNALDWRVWYKNNTALALGGVAVGGLALSLLLSRRSSIESEFFDIDEMDKTMVEPNGRAQLHSTPKSVSRLREVADDTMSAIFGVAADKFQEFMGKNLPGFREHYSGAQRRRSG